MTGRTSRGFTFVEMIMALAIFGIITALATVTITVVRNKANDGAIRTNLSALQLRAELYYREHRNYADDTDDSCTQGMFSDPSIVQSLASADAGSPRTIGDGGIHCRLTPGKYAVWVQRPSGQSSSYWCVDSKQTSCAVDVGEDENPDESFYAQCGTCVAEE